MVRYGSNTAGSYQVVSYTGGNTGYGSVKTDWQKTTCCGAKNFGTPCTSCPG